MREAQAGGPPKLLIYTLTGLGALGFLLAGAAVAVRLWVAQPYRLPSASMEPTVMTGEYVLARNATIVNGAPRVADGDIVFHLDHGRTFIRRVLALPGQSIGFRDGVPIVDGVAATEASAGSGADGVRIVRETLNGRSYSVQYMDDNALDRVRNVPITVTPPGEIYVVGDNRDNAMDSRIIGPVALASVHHVGGWIIVSPVRARVGKALE